ncbi:HAD family hydrolase [Phenylobacterium parvum]|uniref:HAD family hydrolase n=1 Tax=Phenylobacterium parvum TaxID=2201350 RepID=A0A2Z3HUX4_9CAUL|nr:HAD family phosphatase [Phenylobacterium parvum]AWM77946.1 HAD family hydrolase [Phenylobacterium parvum]
MPLPRPPRAVIFDMDGLLFDTEVLYRDALSAAARDMGAHMPEPVFHSLIGLPGESSRRLLLDHFGENFDVDGLWDASAEHFHTLARGQDFLKAGVREFLDLLDALALPRAIATSSRHEDVTFNLGRHGLEGRFHAVAARGDYPRGKPHPDPFLVAAGRLEVDPADCLALEDSHNGVRSAASAGMMTVMVPDLLAATDEMDALCARIVDDLHAAADLVRFSLGA